MQNRVSPPGILRLVQTMGGWLHRGYVRETSILMFHLSYHSSPRCGNGLDLNLGGACLQALGGVRVDSQLAVRQWVL